MRYSYEIDRSEGGWRLRLLEDGEEVGGGWFPDDPADELESESSYSDAHREASAWLDSRPVER